MMRFLAFLCVVCGCAFVYGQGTSSFSFYFPLNSHYIDWNNEANQRSLVLLKTIHKPVTLRLKACTDTLGTEQYNRQLAKRRLNEVVKLIHDSCTTPVQLRQEVVGEDTTYSELAQNRRVEIFVSMPIDSVEPETTSTYPLNTPVILRFEFLFGTDLLVSDSYKELRSLIDFMQRNPSVHLTLKGHVCCGPDLNNLSDKRAQAIKRALIQTGNIASSRIQAFGLGNRYPLYPDDSEEHKQANRRVEATFYRK